MLTTLTGLGTALRSSASSVICSGAGVDPCLLHCLAGVLVGLLNIAEQPQRVIMPLTDSYLPLCPICGIKLCSEGRSRFDCQGCGKTLVVAESRTYRFCRVIGIYGSAAIWAWKRGWEPSFIIFVVSVYVFPVLLLWISIERYVRRMFPPRRFEPERSHFQTLGI
jgi:predicted RNA-binding Zn-ribbon protein involved in translation (DUF1610 family)